MLMKTEIQEFLLGYSGYNGGDIGNLDRPSIWCCGIEWGGENSTAISVQKYFESNEWKTINGFEENDEKEKNITAPYDKVLCKLLCVINGGKVEDYAEFAENQKVWIKGAKTGYFKMNLYPLWFTNTDPNNWDPKLDELLTFADKGEYIRWCRRYRLPAINQLMQKHSPKLILCFGINYEDDFNIAFSDGYKRFQCEDVGELTVRWKRNENGTVVAVLPFPNAPTGLKSHTSIQAIGEYLRELIK